MIKKSPMIEEDIKNIVESIRDLSQKFSGKTILIAGGAGFLGRYLALTLDYLNENVLEKPCKIIILDNFISGMKGELEQKDNLEIIEQDISKPFKINGKIDYIIHAASIASPVFYRKFRLETIDVGILGTKNLLELAKEKNVESFLFMSSSEVYGDPDPKFIPTSEDYLGNVSCIGPRACYDEPKRIGETLCMVYSDIHNLPVKIVRPFNIFGPGMRLDDGRVIPNFVTSALKGEKIPVYTGGGNTRTFCYITDAITGFFQVLLSTHNKEVFNIGSDEQEIQMKHLAEIVSGLVGDGKSRFQHSDGPSEVYSKSNPSRRFPDLTKIRELVGYEVRVNLVTGLKRFIKWVEEELSNKNSLYGLQTSCRICKNQNLKKILSLGETPLANSLLPKQELSKKEELFPLEILYCDNCHLCQLSYVVEPEKMFKNYVYVTSTTETFKKHFKEMAQELKDEFNLNEGSLAVDIGSNDGLLLKELKNFRVEVIGVEPAENICEIARRNMIETMCDFFKKEAVESIIKIKGKADIITGNNVFAHISDIDSIAENVKKLLKKDGVFVIEVQYLYDTIKDLTFDNIYHEHLSYYSVLALKEFFQKHDMEIFKVRHIDTHGGSIRVCIQRKGGKYPIDISVNEIIAKENEAGLNNLKVYEEFAQRVYAVKDKLRKFMQDIKPEGKKIAGYGAPAKATTALNFYGIDNKYIDYIVDDNKLKQGLTVPGVRIPIVSREHLDKNLPDYILILAWNFADEIIRNNQSYKEKGVKFIVPFPELRVV